MQYKMIDEISSQPDIANKCLLDFEKIKLEIKTLFPYQPDRVIFLARGTSDNVATFGNYLIPVISNAESYSMSPALINAYQVKPDLRNALVVAISQSGETQEIVDAAKSAKACGAKLISITNSADSSLDKVSDVTFITPAGREEAVPATKTYTSALMGLLLILAEIYKKNRIFELASSYPELAENQLQNIEIPSEVIDVIANSPTAVIAGRGLMLGGVLEAALKLKESAAINVIGTTVADFVHGPIAAISPAVPLVIVSADSHSPIYPGLVDLMKRARELNSPIITFGDFLEADQSNLHIDIHVPSGKELIAPLLLAIPSQLLSAKVAIAKDLNPDAPLGLKKVTQTA